MRIKTRISSLAISLAIIPLLLATIFIGYISYNSARSSLENQVENSLTAVLQVKKQQISNYFSTIEKQAVSLAASRMTIDAMQAFKAGFNEYPLTTGSGTSLADYYSSQFGENYKQKNNGNSADTQALYQSLPLKAQALQNTFIADNPNPLGSKDLLINADDSSYSATHTLYHPSIRTFLNKFGYYDIFLVDDQTGNIVYSVFKELDYATSLFDGPYADSGIGQAFRAALDLAPGQQAVLTDFAPYLPSYNDPASFIATPIMNNGQRTGVLIFQMPVDSINNIMTFNGDWKSAGLGNTGEVYLVGSDQKLRSNSRFVVEDSQALTAQLTTNGANPEMIQNIATKGTAIGILQVDATTISKAINGNSGIVTRSSYRGNEVLSAYSPIELLGLQWAIVSSIETAEAFLAVSELATSVLLVSGVFLLIALLIASTLGLTLSRKIVQPIETLSAAITQVKTSGDFGIRINIDSKDEVGDAAEAMNLLLADTQQALTETKQVMNRMAEGDFSSQIEAELHGDLASLKDAINQSAAQTRLSMQAISELMHNLSESNFSQRSQQTLRGEYATIVSLTESSMTSLGAAIYEIQTIMQSIAEGDFSARVSSPLKGELHLLKQSLNQSIETLATATREIIDVTELQADGDLSARVTGQYKGGFDTLKEAINAGQAAMQQIINDASISAHGVANAAKEISAGNNDLSKRTNNQSAALEQASSAIKTMAENIQTNSRSAADAEQLAKQAEAVSTTGLEVMQTAVTAMEAIQSSSKRINDIVGLIDGFAFQTNLLALNASVEAARAGVHGKGFAVVAYEVKELAQKSAQAAKDINSLVDSTEKSIDNGVQQVQASGTTLNEITQGISEVARLIEEIATASSQQFNSIEGFSKTITELENVATQNSALVEENSSAAESMSNEARSMLTMMSRFKTQPASDSKTADNQSPATL